MRAVFPTAPVISAEFTIQGEIFRANSIGSIPLFLGRICTPSCRCPILCRGRVVGVINLQHRLPHVHSPRDIKLISTIGFLVGAEIERARLESEVSQLSQRLEMRKLVERAKGILQRDLGISEEDSYRLLQRQSRQMRKSMKEVAEAVVISDELKRTQQS